MPAAGQDGTMYASRHFWVVIAAGGIGRRMGASVPKQLLKLNNRTILENTVQVFRDIPEVDGIVVTAPEEALPAYRALFGRQDTTPGSGPAPAPAETVPGVVPEPTGSSHRIHVIPGGGERQDSVRASLRFLSAQGARDEDIVLIHDGVRPYIGRDLVMRVADGVLRSGAATAAVPARYTMRDITEGTLDRSRLFEIQTPQGFTFDVICRAQRKAAEDGFLGTDDAGLAERIGILPELVEGSSGNVKITVPEDLRRMVRIGTGYDVHRLVPDRKLILGGVEIPYERGLLGHSDADVLLHALMDAILGAACLGDIGHLFPDSDPAYAGISSGKLLEEVASLIHREGYELGNADCTVICQQPKLAEYIPAMRRNIAAALGAPEGAVSVKATTTEKLGFEGRGEGIAAEAVCIIR